MIDETLAQEWFFTALGSAFNVGAVAADERLTQEEKDQYIKSREVCYAVWPDSSVQIGFRMIVIRGYEYYLPGASDGPNNLRTVAFPCVNRAAAEKLLAQYGDPNWPNQFQDVSPQKKN